MKIICIGRNYVAHAAELNNDVPSEPIIFIKNEDTICHSSQMAIPAFSNAIHYECEVVLKINKNIPLNTHIDSIKEVCDEWTLGLDFTARDVQDKLKSKGLPWELAKSFDNSAVIGTFSRIPQEDMYNSELTFTINNVIRQQASLQLMIYNFEAIINYCTQFLSFKAGDLIMTGTPAGVGVIENGQIMKGYLNNQDVLTFEIL